MPSAPQSRLSIFNLIPDSIEHVNPAPVDETSLTVEIAEVPRAEPPLLARPPMQTVKEQPNPQAVASPPPQDNTSLSMSQLLQVLPIIWLAGAIVLAIYVFAGNFRLWSIVKLKRPVTQSRVLDLLEDCKAQMNIHTPLAVVETDKITSPALFGFLRPRLLLPEGMLNALNHAQLRHILLHELAHLKRGDIYLGWLVAILQTVHWFNPIVWFGFNRMRSDRELACDNLALSAMGIEDPAEYGRTIVKLLENFSAPKYNPGLAGILEERSQLKRRITMIAKFKKSSHRISVGAVILIAILSVVSLTDGHTKRGAERLSGKVSANLQDSLLVYYSFDRDAGTKTVDIAGADFHGKLRGAEHISEGKMGGAMSFNGKKDHIQIGRLKLSTFTFAAWIKTQEAGSDLNNRRIFLLDDGKNYYAIQGNIDGGIGAYITGELEVNEYDWQLERDEWTHVALTFDGKQAKIYKNGNLTQTGEAPFDGAITGKAYIAYSGDTDKNNTHDGDFNWHGSLDETAIFNRALSTDEVKQLYKMTGYADQTEAITPKKVMGTWQGTAIDKPEDGGSKDQLQLHLLQRKNKLIGNITGGFVKDNYCELRNLKIDGDTITFEIDHNIENLQMKVTLKLTDGKLQGEGIPINFDEDRYDIVLKKVPEVIPERPIPQSGRLVPGDIVEISVYELLKEGQEAIFKRQVSENGLISLPWSKPIQVKGMDQDQLRKAIVQRYKEENVLYDASVSVIILKNAIVMPVIGVGDVLRISIYELRQEGIPFIKDYVVTESGRVSIPHVGQLLAAGLTEVNIEEEIKEILSPGIIKDPWVTVILLQKDSRGRRPLDGNKGSGAYRRRIGRSRRGTERKAHIPF